MIQRLISLLRTYKDAAAYLFFGVLTTLVNWSFYFVFRKQLQQSVLSSNLLAWALSVLFAFVTNKYFVFRTRSWAWKAAGREFFRFVLCRVGSVVLETALLYLLVDAARLHENYIKLGVGFAVMAVNYLGSKILVFRPDSHRK